MRHLGNISLKEISRKTYIANATRAAREFVDRRFPDSVAAVLFGSSARGDQADSSDLDILVIENRRVVPYHLHFQETDWCFDIMGRSLRFCAKRVLGRGKSWSHRDPDQILLIACAEGVQLKDTQGVTAELKRRANQILANGPAPLTAREISNYRQLITEVLDDFLDARRRQEACFVAYQMVITASQFLMGFNRRWSDEDCKWVYRRLVNDNHPLSRELVNGLDRYYQTDDRSHLSRPIESILGLAGGRLYRDDLSGNPSRPPTRAEQFLQHPILFTRKAVGRVLDDL